MWVTLYIVSDTTPERIATVDVAAEVRAMIGRLRLSQALVAERADIRRSTLSRKLQGGSAFTVDELYRLAAVFGISATDLMPPAPSRASA